MFKDIVWKISSIDWLVVLIVATGVNGVSLLDLTDLQLVHSLQTDAVQLNLYSHISQNLLVENYDWNDA